MVEKKVQSITCIFFFSFQQGAFSHRLENTRRAAKNPFSHSPWERILPCMFRFSHA